MNVCIKSENFCIKNDEFCIKNGECCRLFNKRLATFVPWAARVVIAALAGSPALDGSGKILRDTGAWRRNGSYQILGLDFMVDENMEFSFIEGNPRPGLDQETKWQSSYMVDMVGEMIELVFEVQTAMPLGAGKKKTARSVARHRLWSGESVGPTHAAHGNWRMLWHEGWESCGSVNHRSLVAISIGIDEFLHLK